MDRFRLRELHRRSAVEPVIGHLKAEHRMGCNYLGSVAATPPTLSSPSPAATPAASSDGSGFCCAKSSALSSPSRRSSRA
jgi:IS5 family transposase